MRSVSVRLYTFIDYLNDKIYDFNEEFFFRSISIFLAIFYRRGIFSQFRRYCFAFSVFCHENDLLYKSLCQSTLLLMRLSSKRFGMCCCNWFSRDSFSANGPKFLATSYELSHKKSQSFQLICGPINVLSAICIHATQNGWCDLERWIAVLLSYRVFPPNCYQLDCIYRSQ